MSDKKPFKVDLATVTLIFVLIVAFIIILFCLISKFYNKMQIAKEKVATLNDKIEIIANEKEPVVIETLDIYSDEMFDLYGMIEMVNFSTEIENFHREGKITVDDFTNEEKLIIILSECFSRDLEIENPNIHGWGDIYKKDIENVCKEIFGEGITLEYNDILDQGLEFTYDKNEEKYVSEINSKTMGALPNIKDITDLVYAEKIDNKVYLYDRFVRVLGPANIKDDPVGIYATSDKKVVIDDKISRDDINSMLSGYYFEGIKYDINEAMFSIRSNYRDDVLMFRHEFEINADGTYKWLSSAPIK